MALDIALAVIGPAIQVAKWASKPIIRQFNYLCCFSSNINSLKDEDKKLVDALKGLEGEVEVGRDNVLNPAPEVETWLTESKKIKDEINGILNEATNVESGCSKLGARFSLSRRAKKTTESTEKLRGEKPIATFLPRPKAAKVGVQLGKTFECESRNKIEEEIMTTLRGGDVNMIGICGMGGLGKTTMAKKLMNKALHESVFEEVVMAVVSQNVDISKIQDEIGGQLGLDKLKEESSQSAREQILLSRLSDTKRTTLLVLDDVWEKPSLERIGIPCDSKWCTIIFTSRNADVLRAMDVRIFGMKVLSEEEAWSFFRERVGTCVDDRKLNPIAKEVAKECGQLPINLAVVGAGLKNQRIQGIWKDTLRKLKQSVPDTVEYDKQNYNPLKWSYDYLNSKEAQSIFLLCCLFPEDADIPLEYLNNFYMGLGICEDITNMEDAMNMIRTQTQKLKDRSLVLESDEEDCVRLHDVVRDVCIFIAKEKGYIGKDGCTWISSSHLVGERNQLLNGSRCPNLRLLFLDSRYDSSRFKFDDAFLEGIRELYVLCIKNYDSLTALPHPKQSLGKLNTLFLDSCEELETISIVGELVHLEILICRNCERLEKLPSQMKGLNRLKVLELTGCVNLQSIERGIISSLVALEELKMLRSFGRWEGENREERENAGLRELEALTNLACLEIDINDRSLVTQNMPLLSKEIVRFKIRTDINSYLPPGFSKAMGLNLERETRLGDWIEMQFLRDTEYLHLSGDGANNVDLAKIPNIRCLELEYCESMKNVVRTSRGDDDATVFPSIECLELRILPKVEVICDGPISPTSFQNLKELELKFLKALTQIWKSSSECENINYVPHFTNLSTINIWGCDSLHNLGQLSMAGKDCLPQLQKFFIKGCEMMEQLFLWNDEEAGENKTRIESQQKHQVITKVFPKLKEVELESLPNLTTFYQGIQGVEFPLLREMKIEGCPKMKGIIQPQKVSFGSLEVLEINKYVGSILFTLSMAANFVSLKELRIANCDEMINVIEDEQQQETILLFPKLEDLYLRDLPKLVTLCEWKREVELPSLRVVTIYDCPNMENFSMGVVATPNLEAFTTDLRTYVGVGVGVGVAFNSLKELDIKQSENPLYDDKISLSLFNGLETLRFIGFEGNMSLFSSLVVGNLVNLRVLELNCCDEIVKVIEDKEEEKVVSGRCVVFPKLEELTLFGLPKLVSFCEWKCDVELPSLTKVEISLCYSMESFSKCDIDLPSLTKVEIHSCYSMESFSMGFVAAPNLKIVQIGNYEVDITKDLNETLHQYYLDCQEKEISEEEEISSEVKDEIEEDDDQN